MVSKPPNRYKCDTCGSTSHYFKFRPEEPEETGFYTCRNCGGKSKETPEWKEWFAESSEMSVGEETEV